MRNRALATLAAVSLALAACSSSPPAAVSSEQGVQPLSSRPGEVDVIVVLKPAFAPGSHIANQARAADVARGLGLAPTYTYGSALFGFAASVPEGRLEALRRDPRVAYVNLDRELHAFGQVAPSARPTKPGDGGDTTAAQTVPTGIARIGGKLSTTKSGDGSGSVSVNVAVIDTGIDIDHPDLNVVGGKNCSRGNSYDDGNGHGTHVAGTIGAKDNDLGVVGVAPNARLFAVRVLDNAGMGSWSSVACGVDWVTSTLTDSVSDNNVQVANMSLGGSGTEPNGSDCSTGDALHDVICSSVTAGVTYAVAAGNSAVDSDTAVPAAYDEVITVSALADFDGVAGGLTAATCRADEDDTFANFSNFGADVDIIAPGVCINSTWKGGGYNTISGTSMASPHVAGAAALYKSVYPGKNPEEVKNALQLAGNHDWDNRDDKDATKEKLLSVAGL